MLENVEGHTLVYPVTHGGRVELPQLGVEDDYPLFKLLESRE